MTDTNEEPEPIRIDLQLRTPEESDRSFLFWLEHGNKEMGMDKYVPPDTNAELPNWKSSITKNDLAEILDEHVHGLLEREISIILNPTNH